MNRKVFRKRAATLLLVGVLMFGMLLPGIGAREPVWSEREMTFNGVGQGIMIVTNPGGATLSYSKDSGVTLLEKDGFAFKDLNKNGKLDPYEDWRLDAKTRATSLAELMMYGDDDVVDFEGLEAIAGLKLYSSHTTVNSDQLSATTRKNVLEDNLRAILLTTIASQEIGAKYNNNLQKLCESSTYGIPANNSSDPRHGTTATAEYDIGNGGKISMWPTMLGVGATFDPTIAEQFGRIASIEYRGLGITTALSPQVDLATDPRWGRVNGTFGEDPYLSADMARGYVDGFQISEGADEIEGGWGYTSVNAMVKHWPGGGTGEGGRDAHYGYGKYAVFPGNGLELQMIPFVDGAFDLRLGTKQASAVMPYYTISTDQDPTGGNVGNSFSKYIIQDLLRDTYQYDNVVCTDWNITYDSGGIGSFTMCHGLEDVVFPAELQGKSSQYYAGTADEAFTAVDYRHYLVARAGVDQHGGNNVTPPVIKAYEMMCILDGKAVADRTILKSAQRLLKNVFQVGLFEDPYLDIQETIDTVGKAEYMAAGFEAQLKSMVMLKNANNALPQSKGKKVYLVQSVSTNATNAAANKAVIGKYYTVVDTPEEADFALVMVSTPNSGSGYSAQDAALGGNGFVPMSLQYGDYTAEYARETSLAGDAVDVTGKYVSNRTYKGKTVTNANNLTDLNRILDTATAMGDKPVIVNVKMSKPQVWSEFEGQVDGIVVDFNNQTEAVMKLVSGEVEPNGLLPIQQPANMREVEEQFEDMPRDMVCHTDSEGNVYDFGFGLNWSGRIVDERTMKYAGVGNGTVVSAPQSAKVGEVFSMELYLPRNVTAVKLVNESGKAVGLAKVSATPDNEAMRWVLSTSVGTAGTGRRLTVLTRIGNGAYEDRGIQIVLDIIKNETTVGMKAEVKTAAFSAPAVKVNQPVRLIATTNAITDKINVINEYGSGMGKTLVAKKNINASNTEWTYEIAIGTAGSGRQFTVIAAKADGVYNFDRTCVVSINVYK